MNKLIVISIVIVILIAIVLGIVFGLKKKSQPITYSCDTNSGKCMEDSSSKLLLDECEKQCQKYIPPTSMVTCEPTTGNCVPDENGTMTKQDCSASCKAPQPQPGPPGPQPGPPKKGGCTNSCECGQFVDSHCYIGNTEYAKYIGGTYACGSLVNKGNSFEADTSMAGRSKMKCINKPGEPTNGCCFWGRGAVQLTGPNNYGIVNQIIKYNKQTLSDHGITEDICADPSYVCKNASYQWFSTLTYWTQSVQGYVLPSDPTPKQTLYEQELDKFITGGCSLDRNDLLPPTLEAATNDPELDCRNLQFDNTSSPYPFAMGCFGAVNAGLWNGTAGLWYIRLKGFVNIMKHLLSVNNNFKNAITEDSIKDIYAKAKMASIEAIAKVMVEENPLNCGPNQNDTTPPGPIPDSLSNIDALWDILDVYTNNDLLLDDNDYKSIRTRFLNKDPYGNTDNRYGAVGLAALLANAFEETGNLATCDETNWGNTCSFCTSPSGHTCTLGSGGGGGGGGGDSCPDCPCKWSTAGGDPCPLSSCDDPTACNSGDAPTSPSTWCNLSKDNCTRCKAGWCPKKM